jgi:hypothetical protein
MHVVALDGTNTFHRCHMRSIGREYRHQTSVDRKVSTIAKMQRNVTKKKDALLEIPENNSKEQKRRDSETTKKG